MFLNWLAGQYNIIGMIGVALILGAYFLLQIDRLQQDSILFSLMNTIGSFLVLVSLCFAWNLPSGIIEIAWLVISIFGFIKACYFRWKKH